MTYLKQPSSKTLDAGFANLLIYGDNLSAMKMLMDEHGLRGKVGLVYIDPPFATNAHYTIGQNRTRAISRSASDTAAYSDKMVGTEFLEFLRARLLLLHELMAPHASIYLHIDYKVGHYVKVLMDEVFGIDNFRGDITRIKCNPKNFSRRAYGNIKDMILFYTKTDNYTWNNPRSLRSAAETLRLFKKIDAHGRHYTTIPLHAPGETLNGATGKKWRDMQPPEGRHWRSNPDDFDRLDAEGLIEWSKNGVPRKKIYADEKLDKKPQDIWDFKDPQNPTYPTEKNLELLKFIINASSKEGDIVLDCFSGSGTTMAAAAQLNRSWIGIDSSPAAIRVAKQRLDSLKPNLLSTTDKYQNIQL